ncbi:MAG: HIT family protein [Deltaproteobacteria bacterium]|nr:HIT family protein [Deltaproteobacteria bacterium]
MATCPLCSTDGGTILYQNVDLRVVLVELPAYPGYCRVILRAHVAEMSDLDADLRHRLMITVFAVEEVLREVVGPDKVNLASLGNLVPHLHWHVIPRFRDDPCFPDSIWSAATRAGHARPTPNPKALAEMISDRIVKSLRFASAVRA